MNKARKKEVDKDNLSLCWKQLLHKLLHQDDFYDTVNSSLKTKLGIHVTKIYKT